jgi:hypothetical protein
MSAAEVVRLCRWMEGLSAIEQAGFVVVPKDHWERVDAIAGMAPKLAVRLGAIWETVEQLTTMWDAAERKAKPFDRKNEKPTDPRNKTIHLLIAEGGYTKPNGKPDWERILKQLRIISADRPGMFGNLDGGAPKRTRQLIHALNTSYSRWLKTR